MKKEFGFYFIPKRWLGDVTILTMDWDCRAMHFHLMCIASQQEKQGYLLDDDTIFRKLLANPDINDWNNRIKPQIFSAWKQKTIKENGKQINYWFQPGLLKSLNEDNSAQQTVSKKKTKKEFIEFDEQESQQDGFNLKSLLKLKDDKTILYVKPPEATTEEKSSIWTLGVQFLSKQESDHNKIRGFLARQIKQFGDKAVAQAIAQISISSIQPADAFSYLVGAIQKQYDGTAIKKTGRGSVSI